MPLVGGLLGGLGVVMVVSGLAFLGCKIYFHTSSGGKIAPFDDIYGSVLPQPLAPPRGGTGAAVGRSQNSAAALSSPSSPMVTMTDPPSEPATPVSGRGLGSRSRDHTPASAKKERQTPPPTSATRAGNGFSPSSGVASDISSPSVRGRSLQGALDDAALALPPPSDDPLV